MLPIEDNGDSSVACNYFFRPKACNISFGYQLW